MYQHSYLIHLNIFKCVYECYLLMDSTIHTHRHSSRFEVFFENLFNYIQHHLMI